MNLLVNKFAKRNYEIIDTFEAGMKLSGWEVKTLRQKHGSIKESYVTIDNEVFLINAHIPLFQPNQKIYEGSDPYQKRKLLLSRRQIEKLKSELKQKGLSIIPLRIYKKGQLIKIEIAVGKGKKQHDKRADLKNRTSKREAERAIKICNMNKIKKGKYKHYKGKEYEVIGTGKHSETLEDLVIYKALYSSKEFGNKTIWVRPLRMFTEKVTYHEKEVSRFEYLEK